MEDTRMNPRMDVNRYLESAPFRAMLALQHAVETSGLEHSTLELVKIGISVGAGLETATRSHVRQALGLGLQDE